MSPSCEEGGRRAMSERMPEALEEGSERLRGSQHFLHDRQARGSVIINLSTFIILPGSLATQPQLTAL
eukprot:2607073-Rhodomonas_salina.1